MGTYKIKKSVILAWKGSFLLLSTMFILIAIYKTTYFYVLTALLAFIIAIVIGALLSNSLITTNDEGIIISGPNKRRLERKWPWIYEIKSVRSTTTGDYTTILYWAMERQEKVPRSMFAGFCNNSKSGTVLITSYVAEYRSLLQEIREKTPHAVIDNMTDQIISKGI